MKGITLALACIIALGWPTGAPAEEPALPPGLGETEQPTTEPELPSGLGAPSTEPDLPSGLGEGADEPGLPPGPGGPADEPGLPPGLGESTEPEEAPDESPPRLRDRLPITIGGFWDTRAGIRIRDDYVQPSDATLAETRLQLKSAHHGQNLSLEFTGDVYLDGVPDKIDGDLRQLRLSFRPAQSLDVRLGRQVLTWGTGDLLFINDMFPKDWNSFFIGRDVEYLKAPSDAVRIGWFTDIINVDLVYTPQFDADRFITGDRISYWNPLFRRHMGRDDTLHYDKPARWFRDPELGLRLYRSVGTFELAFYGYRGYWKSPGGQRLWPPMQAIFPRLNVYGASLRGPIGGGIGNMELGYYDSREDTSGNRPFINNSEFRLLLGYEQEIGQNFTGAVQYYLEHMTNYGSYRDSLPFFLPARDKNRYVLTLRLTKLLMNQNLTLSLFTYYSPSDQDAYLRPNVNYKVSDSWTIEAGGNLFIGSDDHTFFGQFENNSNVYAGVRFSF